MRIQNILATKGPEVITIRPDETLREAIALLSRFNIGGLVVVDDARRLIGIITERDIIRQAAKNEDLFAWPVHDVMTTDVIVATPDDEVESVARTMTERHFRHLPIMDQGRLIGMVSIGDVVKAQRDQFRGEVDTLQTQMTESC